LAFLSTGDVFDCESDVDKTSKNYSYSSQVMENTLTRERFARLE